MKRLVVVDGYNVILRSAELRPGEGGRTLRESREKLINLLSWAIGGGDAKFLVVFDGAEGGKNEEATSRVEVRFSRPPEKADDLIRAIVEREMNRVDRLTVVTSDLEVARHARAMGADISLADLFLAAALGPRDAEAPEKPASLSKKEIEDWAELFKARQGSEIKDDDETAH